RFFFFQAEDGIRDRNVTGVQTCALPISRSRSSRVTTAPRRRSSATSRSNSLGVSGTGWPPRSTVRDAGITSTSPNRSGGGPPFRSEERRVGKEWSTRGRPDDRKRKHDHQ